MARNSALVFFSALVREPRRVGAIGPSGPNLGRVMAREVDLSRPGIVVELGGGTGSITRALLLNGVSDDRLLVVEREPDLHSHLCEKFPSVRVVRGDALNLGGILEDQGLSGVNAVVSGLPLLNFPESMRIAFLQQAFSQMDEDGVFIQFTYGVTCPIPKKRLQAAGFQARPVSVVWRNFPPATVWRFSRLKNID